LIEVIAVKKCILLTLVVSLLLPACAKPPSPEHLRDYLRQAMEGAKQHSEAGNGVEACQLVNTVLLIDQDYPEASNLRDELCAQVDNLYGHPFLGSNFSIRPEVERSTVTRVLLYLPDRILDVFDLISFDVHFGPGAFANVHATRAVQVGGGARAIGGLGWHDHRSLGGMGQAESGLTLFGLGAHAYSGALVGTSGVFAANDTLAGLHRPSSKFYQRLRDYWAVGFGVTAFGGMDFDFHPVELADLVVGFAAVDLLNDDFAGTRSLRLSRAERRVLYALYQVKQSEETMQAYLASPDETPSGSEP
jgi:hypothetical protein